MAFKGTSQVWGVLTYSFYRRFLPFGPTFRVDLITPRAWSMGFTSSKKKNDVPSASSARRFCRVRRSRSPRSRRRVGRRSRSPAPRGRGSRRQPRAGGLEGDPRAGGLNGDGGGGDWGFGGGGGGGDWGGGGVLGIGGGWADGLDLKDGFCRCFFLSTRRMVFVAAFFPEELPGAWFVVLFLFFSFFSRTWGKRGETMVLFGHEMVLLCWV